MSASDRDSLRLTQLHLRSKGASPDLPYVRKKAVEVLTVNYTTRAVAQQTIKSEITAFYQINYPGIDGAKQALVQQAGQEVANIYLRNIFPEMHVTWGTHPNNLGHNDSPGCFRCHDGNHTSADGQTITNDCSACHQILTSGAYSDDVDGRFQRDVNGHSGHVNKVGAQRRWDYNHARHHRD